MIHHDGEWSELPGDVIDTANDHGTGCTFSAVVATALAAGMAPLDAIVGAKDFVRHLHRTFG